MAFAAPCPRYSKNPDQLVMGLRVRAWEDASA